MALTGAEVVEVRKVTSSGPINATFQTTTQEIANLGPAGGGVTSFNALTGAVVLAAGSNVTLTPVGNTITIASTGGGGGTGQTVLTPNSFSVTNSFLINNVNLNTPDFVAVSVDPAAITAWTRFTVKDAAGNAGMYAITITPTSGLFDGLSSFQIFQNYGKVSFYSDGTNLWT